MSSFDFSKITGTPITTSITRSAPSLVMRRTRGTFDRRTPYDQPSVENTKTGIQNLEKLIQTFYTNVYNSIKLEISYINEKINDILKSSLSELVIASQNPGEMEEISKINKKINELIKDKSLSELQKIAINALKLSLNAMTEENGKTPDLHDIKMRLNNKKYDNDDKLIYKLVLVLIIIMYKLNELLIKPNIDNLKAMRGKHDNDYNYLLYLKKAFFNNRDYFRILNIRGFYKMMIGDETSPSIDYFVSYSNFLYGLVLNKEDKQKLNLYLSKEEITKLNKIDAFYYERYYIPHKHSGGRRGIKSNCVMKDIKELCKANKIKLSRIIDGKRVVYKMTELITKLKRKKIKIPKSLH